MTAMLERMTVHSDRAAARASQVRFAAVLVAIVTFPFFALGWLAAKTWFSLVFIAMAVAEGWQSGRPLPDGQRG